MMSQPDKVADFIVKAVTTLNAHSHIDETQAGRSLTIEELQWVK
jgi:hypothetical protein